MSATTTCHLEGEGGRREEGGEIRTIDGFPVIRGMLHSMSEVDGRSRTEDELST